MHGELNSLLCQVAQLQSVTCSLRLWRIGKAKTIAAKFSIPVAILPKQKEQSLKMNRFEWIVSRFIPATKHDVVKARKRMELAHKRSINAIVQSFAQHNKPFTIRRYARDIQLYLPYGGFDHIQTDIFLDGDFYESKQLAWLCDQLPSRDLAIDAGANIGNHSIYYAALAGFKKVYSFEPNDMSFKWLVKNIKLNGLEGVIDARKQAVGAEVSQGYTTETDLERLVVSEVAQLDHPKLSSRSAAPESAIDIVPIDSLQAATDLLKIDVEGMAVEVLKGAKQTIEAHRPAIYIEAKGAERKGLDIIKDWGYQNIVPLITIEPRDRRNFFCTYRN